MNGICKIPNEEQEPGETATTQGFTLRTYTHLMPASEDRMRRAIDAALGSAASVTAVTSEGR